MTSRRRRSRITLTSVLVVLALAVGGYALDATGVLGPDADATGTTAAGGPTAGETTTIGPQQASSGASPASSPTVSRGTDADAVRARTQLADLPVKGKAAGTGYDRTGDFGSAWLDVDRNGCDTRNDVLARDLADITREGRCKVLTGTLVSPYTGATVDFVRGNTTSTLVQIDHIRLMSWGPVAPVRACVPGSRLVVCAPAQPTLPKKKRVHDPASPVRKDEQANQGRFNRI